ncbi:MAG: hypothetical protein DRP89_08240 [Candidatus Neomarinimicrobiota bacterium]|nr:MAG: hypothetical protein DRP89_08240 [Candidatus Neomarinimicrobiota bacterium]
MRSCSRRRFPFLTFAILMLLAFSLVFAQTGKLRTLLDEAEKLHDANDYNGTMLKLREAEKIDKNNPEVLWKIARAYFDFSDQEPDNEEVQKKNLYPGFEYAKRCVEIAPNIAGGHQYYAILIGRIGEIEGTKQKIKNSYAVKEHTLKAIELDPDEPGNYHVMGRWHFALADLSWIERQIASIIYATPPKASFEEAEKYFLKAHELEPDDVRHVLWLGKTYIELDKEDQARKMFETVLKMKAESDSDKAMQNEARELLKKL